MIFTNLDIIVRRSLLEKRLPIHWYMNFLCHASACVRELSTDTLKIINVENLPVNDYGSVDLPDDFVDDISVAIPTSGLLRNVPKKSNINPLRLHNGTTGAFTPYTVRNLNDSNLYGFYQGFIWYWNFNDYGEPTGRFFGARGGERFGYQVFKERRQIQLTGEFTNGNIVLLYISDGQRSNNLTQIDALAFSTVQSYINWGVSPNAGNRNSNEGDSYYKQKRELRARLNDMTKTDIINIIRNSYTATIKN